MKRIGRALSARGFFDPKGAALSVLAFAIGVLILQYAAEKWQKQIVGLVEESSRQMEWELEQEAAYHAQFGEQQYQMPEDITVDLSQPMMQGGSGEVGD